MQSKNRTRNVSRLQHTLSYAIEPQAVARLVVGIKAKLDIESQHGVVKTYTPEERAAFAARRGLAC